MTFLNPLMLWGAGLAAIPILIHLFNRRRYRRLPWAAMEFLLAALKKNQRRLRIENILVLIVRTMILLLLALAISRPFFADSKAIGAIQRGRMSLVLVVDNSYSMDLKTGLSTPFAKALDQAAALVGALEREDTVSVVVTADNLVKHDLAPRAVLRESADLEKARSLLGRIRVSPLPSALAPALRAALDVLDQPAESRRLVVLTDLQAAFWDGRAASEGDLDQTARDLLEQIEGRGVSIAIVDVGASNPRNASVTAIRPAFRRATVAGTKSTWHVDLESHGPVPTEVELTLRADGRKVESRMVVLPAAAGPGKPGRVSESFSLVFSTPGDHSLVADITTDALPVDDRRTTAVRVRDRIRILAVDGDPNPTRGGRAETWLLKNILEINRDGPRDSPIQVDVVDVLALATTRLTPYDLVILANVDRVRDETVRDLERYVEGGRSLVIFLGDRVDPEITNQALLRTDDGLLPARLGRNVIRSRDDPARYLLEGTEHPMLVDIAGNTDMFPSPPIYGFNKVVPVDSPTVRVLATYDDLDRSPAIVERYRRAGRTVLFTTACDTDWGDLGPSTQNVAMLHDCVHDLTWIDPSAYNRRVGQVLELRLPEGVESVRATRPRGVPLDLDPIGEEGGVRVRLRDTEEPGLYAVEYQRPGGDPLAANTAKHGRRVFAFGLDPREGDVTRLSPGALQSRLRGLDVLVTRDGNEVLARPAEARQGEIWRVLLMAVLGLLLLESLLARRFGDHARREGR